MFVMIRLRRVGTHAAKVREILARHVSMDLAR